MSRFQGFPKEAIEFLVLLGKNNSKEWFEKHKKDYEVFVRHPSQDFVVAMGERLKEISPKIYAIPKVNQSLFRLNRDVRFSENKRPYKTNLGILFWEGNRKRMESSGFYFHVEKDTFMLGAGMYRFSKELMDVYREAVIDKKLGNQLKKVVNQIKSAGYLIGEYVTRGCHVDMTLRMSGRIFCCITG